MLLSEIMDSLRYGELRNSHYATDISAATNPGLDRVISAIQQALDAIYVKFPLKFDSVVLDLSSTTAGEQAFDAYYKQNVNSDFNNDIMYFTAAYSMPETGLTYDDQEVRTSVPLNTPSDPLSVYTTSPTTLVVPQHYFDTVPFLRLEYRAIAPVLPRRDTLVTLDPVAPYNYWVDIDPQFLNAITSFVVYKLFSSIDVGDQKSISMTALRNFNASCSRIEHFGMYHVVDYPEERVSSGGWV